MDSLRRHARTWQVDPVLWGMGLFVVYLGWQLAAESTNSRSGVVVAGLLMLTLVAVQWPRTSWSGVVLLVGGVGLSASAAVAGNLGLGLCLLGCCLGALFYVASVTRDDVRWAGDVGQEGTVAESVVPARLARREFVVCDGEDSSHQDRHRTVGRDGLTDGEFGEDVETDELDDDEFEADERSGVMGILLQQWERRQLDGGGELLTGTVRVQLAAGERLQVIHVPLHPPLNGLNSLWLEVIEGERISVEEDVVRPYGVRLIVRRQGRSLDPLSAVISVTATNTAQVWAA